MVDEQGNTALMIAAREGHKKVRDGYRRNEHNLPNPNISFKAFSHPFFPIFRGWKKTNETNPTGPTAPRSSPSQVVDALVAAGADLAVQNGEGKTAAELAKTERPAGAVGLGRAVWDGMRSVLVGGLKRSRRTEVKAGKEK